ncbi:protein ALP1-like [Lotus japonicus]|uniref:protein ALP1-like n=1 Tax=Lotus japonicus TaxID=34305 RepID=UPI00258DFDC2|nr:protein ALP1-like [Lotus japonicus]
MDLRVVDTSVLLRKRKRNEEEEAKLQEQITFIVASVVAMLLGVVACGNVFHILAHNLKYRVVHFTYYRSKETISRQFNNVLRAVMKVSGEYLKFQDHNNLEGSEAYKWRWFQNSIGALDGTHIPVTVAAEDKPRYRNRKGDISTNVLGICGPDLKFIYVLPGWEGSAGDSRVLRDALRRQNHLQIPNGKYFLVDAGYTNGPGFLAPYRGTRYHLNEWIENTPQNYKELFNLRHASARNVIERSFGILKKRWSKLRTPSFFDIKTQIRMINACFVLHNFIRDEQQYDPILEVQDLELLSVVDEELTSQHGETITSNVANEVTTIQVSEAWTTFRDTLAMDICFVLLCVLAHLEEPCFQGYNWTRDLDSEELLEQLLY